MCINWGKFQSMSHVTVYCLFWQLSDIWPKYIYLPHVLMYIVKYKPGDQEELSNTFQHTDCGRGREDQHMKYRQF